MRKTAFYNAKGYLSHHKRQPLTILPIQSCATSRNVRTNVPIMNIHMHLIWKCQNKNVILQTETSNENTLTSFHDYDKTTSKHQNSNMKTLITTIIALSLGITTAWAQHTATSVLHNMPNELLPYINDNQMDEIGKFTIDNDTVKIKNELNGTSTVTTINDDFAKVDLNESSLMLIKLLPVNDSTQIVCLVRTVKTPVPESDVNFYTTSWKKINSRFNLPDTHDDEAMVDAMTQRPDGMSEARFNELRDYLEPVIISADIPEGGNTIVFTMSVPLTTEKERNDVKAILRQKTFKWNGTTFKMY